MKLRDGRDLVSTKFYAVNKESGERWRSSEHEKQFLVMYDSGYLGVVTKIPWNGSDIKPLDTKVWSVVIKDNIKRMNNG